jgi:nicotinamide-nucleotide amidase
LALKGEIITIGNELISGSKVDTNGPYLAERLYSKGISVPRIISVGDDQETIAHAVRESVERADLVLLTGGLGPTTDDITTEVTAQALKRKLVLHPETWERIKKLIRSFGAKITDGQKKQAYLPEGAELIPNRKGTAPGYLLKEARALLVVLPGVPREMKAMVEEAVLPRLEKEWKDRPCYRSRTIMVFGIPESKANDLLIDITKDPQDLQIAFLPHFPEIRVRLTVEAPSVQGAERKLAQWEEAVRARLEPYVFGVDGESMEAVVGNLLREKKATIAVAESCTGGLIGHRLTNVSGSSDYLERVVVTYSNQAKIDLLKVPEHIIQSHGAVSEPTARFMAEGVRELAGADFGLSTTGIAGPTGGSPEKPVGTVFISLADEHETQTKLYHFHGDRHQIKLMTAQVALNRLRQYLLQQKNAVL